MAEAGKQNEQPSLPNAETRKPSTPPASPTAEVVKPNPTPSWPNFAGTWHVFESTLNGKPEAFVGQPIPIVITQDGPIVHVGGHDATIPDAGAAFRVRIFDAIDFRNMFVPTTEDHADRITTVIWRLDGSFLVSESTIEYRRAYGQHPPGTDVRIRRFRRD